MTRPHRLLIDNESHLIHLQGIQERKVFLEDQDYKQYLLWVNEEAQAHNCILHAYLLLPQQIYLLLEPEHGKSLSRLMQALGRRYVRHLNQKEKRTGTLWNGRFKSSPLQRKPWMKHAIHYLVYKPVTEGLCQEPKHYPWSSYRQHVFQHLDYLQELKKPPGPQISSQIEVAISRNKPLGNDDFIEQVYKGSE
ncbi:transposase [Marinospirillum sp.]|uniref:transposase n=1 Tax=Marinospirillum sp. TaxID=2183934 RepID=UPI00384B90A0